MHINDKQAGNILFEYRQMSLILTNNALLTNVVGKKFIIYKCTYVYVWTDYWYALLWNISHFQSFCSIIIINTSLFSKTVNVNNVQLHVGKIFIFIQIYQI